MLEAYAVGVRISLKETVTTGILAMSRAFRAAHADATAFQSKLDSIKFRFAAGAGLLAGGALGLMLLKPSLEEAKRLQEQMAIFSTFGMGDKANAEALRFAKNMNVVGSSYVDNMKHMIEAQGVFRESGALTLAEQLKGAKLAAPILAKIDFANAVLHPDLAGSRHASALSMLRFIETRGGVNDPNEFNRIANLGYKAIQSSGGNISWELLRQFMAHGGTAAQSLSDKALFGEFEPLLGELKSKAAVALSTSYNRMEGIIKLPNQIAHLLVDQGIWRKNDVIWNSQGGIKRFRDSKSPLTSHGLFETDSPQWYEKVIRPIYAKLGLDRAGVLRENAVIFGRSGGQLYNLIERQLPAIHRSVDAQRKAMGIDQSVKAASGTALGKEAALRAQLNNLEASAGSAILPIYIGALKTLEPILWSISDWAKRHPGELKAVIYAWGALSAVMAFSGTVLLVSSAFSTLKLVLGVSEGVGVAGAAVRASLGLGRITMALGLLALVYEAYKNPVNGKFDKGHEGQMGHWTPDWMKGTFWEKPIDWTFGMGGKSSTPPIQVTTNIHVDGKQIARAVTMHQGNAASAPATGPSGFDGRLTPAYGGPW